MPSASGLVAGAAGNFYGTTYRGGASGGGVVSELVRGSSGWSFVPIYSFTEPSCGPLAGVAIDAAGNLYGTTWCGGFYNAGTVFKLACVNGNWTHTSLHDVDINDGYQPTSSVVVDASGNLFGTAYYGGFLEGYGGYGCGIVWEITP